MPYVDGFIVPVPKKKLAGYKKISLRFGKAWKEYGAIDYHECVADDVAVGKWTSFPRAVKLKKGETVVFSWITYKSRKQRDAIMKKIMSDKRFDNLMKPNAMPFDTKRMIFGGFKSFVDL